MEILRYLKWVSNAETGEGEIKRHMGFRWISVKSQCTSGGSRKLKGISRVSWRIHTGFRCIDEVLGDL